MNIITIDGSVALTVARAAKALDCGRSTIYRRIATRELEVVRFDGRPKITARSIVKLLGLSDEVSFAFPGVDTQPFDNARGRTSNRRRATTAGRIQNSTSKAVGAG